MSEIDDIITMMQNEDRESDDPVEAKTKPKPKRVNRFKGTVPKRGTKEYETYRKKCLNGTIKKNGRPFDPDVIAKEKEIALRKYRRDYYRKYRAEQRAHKQALIVELREIEKAAGMEPAPKKKRKYSKRKTKLLSYEQAKDIVQFEGLTSAAQYDTWYKYNKPASMPANPYNVYTLSGDWKGWADFTGVKNEYPAMQKVNWRPYKDALAYAQTLYNVNTAKDWMDLGKAGKLPPDIPTRPDVAYRSYGNHWISWSVFLRKKGQTSSIQYLMKTTDSLLYILRVPDPINTNLYKIGVTVGGLSSIRDAIDRYSMQYVMAYNIGSDVDNWKTLIERMMTEHWDMPGVYEVSNMSNVLLTLDQIWTRVSLS